MLKNIQIKDFWQQSKEKLFEVIRKTNVMFSNVNNIYFLILQTIISVLFIAMMITDGIFPKQTVTFFKVILFSNIASTFNIDPLIVTIVIFVFCLGIVLLALAHFIFTEVFDLCNKIFLLLIKAYLFFIVSLVNYGLVLYFQISQQNEQSSKAFCWLAIVMIALALVVCLVYIKFEIRILRKKCNIWNINNDLHFYGLCFMVFKTWFVVTYGVKIFICLTSLIVWSQHRKMIKGCINSLEADIQYSTYNYIAATDLSVLISLVTKNQTFAFSIWVISVIMLTNYNILLIYRCSIEDLVLPACNSPPEQFYNFFFKVQAKYKLEQASISQNDKESFKNMYSFHKLICVQKCHFNSRKKRSYIDLRTEISQLISMKKGESIKNCLINELWALEMGGKCQTKYLMNKQQSLLEDFILHCIQKLSQDSETTIKNIQSSKNAHSKLFYDMIFQICNSYSSLYEQISKATPKADCIVKSGILIISQIERLKSIYSDLLRLKLINFKMVEIYIVFFNNFVHQHLFDEASINLMTNIQKAIDFEDINENYLPTLTIYPETGAIEGANGQAQKFLQMTRFQIKYKTASNLFFPLIPLEQVKQRFIKDGEAEELVFYSFFKKAEKKYTFGKLRMSYKYLKQKKLLVAQVETEHYGPTQNVIYIDDEFNLQIMLHRQMFIKFNEKSIQNTIRKQWMNIFEDNIKPCKNRIMESQVTKIELQNSLILIVKRLSSALLSSKNILYLQVMKSDISSKQQRRSSEIFRRSLVTKQQESQFEFHYIYGVGSGDSVKIAGFNKPQYQSIKLLTTIHNIEKGLQLELVQNYANKSFDYAKDIKTYRLFDGDLYNIDLQDKQAYNQSFEKHVDQTNQASNSDKNHYFLYFMAIVFALALSLVGLSLVYYSNVTDVQRNMQSTYSKYIKIHMFELNMNRILGLLRDYQSNLTSSIKNFDTKKQIDDTYKNIQNFRTQNIFGTKSYGIKLDNTIIEGTLYQLIQSMKSEIFEILKTKNLRYLHEIQLCYINQIQTFLQQNQKQLQKIIQKNIDFIKSANLKFILISLAIIIMLFFFMILFCSTINVQTKKKLHSLLSISDQQAKSQKENASKMKYIVQMLSKNFDVNIDSQMKKEKCFKKRKMPKESTLSKEIKFAIIFLVIIGFANHITVIVVLNLQFNQQLSKFHSIVQSSHQIISTYITSSFITSKNYYTAQFNFDLYQQMVRNIIHFTLNFQYLDLKPNLRTQIQKFLFGNSCQIANQKIKLTEQKCQRTIPGFSIQNPFEIGFLTFIHRQNYYLTSNLTENFGHTGIYSKQLTKILLYFASQFQGQGLNLIESSLKTVVFLNIYIIFIDCLYIVVFILIYLYFVNQYSKIKQISMFFKSKQLKQSQNADEISKALLTTDNLLATEQILQTQSKQPKQRQLMSEGNG